MLVSLTPMSEKCATDRLTCWGSKCSGTVTVKFWKGGRPGDTSCGVYGPLYTTFPRTSWTLMLEQAVLPQGQSPMAMATSSEPVRVF